MMRVSRLKQALRLIATVSAIGLIVIDCSDRSAGISGEIRNPFTNDPLGGITIVGTTWTDIVEEGSSDTVTAKTNKDGSFDLNGMITDKRYTICVHPSEGLMSDTLWAMVPSAGQTTVHNQRLTVSPHPPEGIWVYTENHFVPFQGERHEIQKDPLLLYGGQAMATVLTFIEHDSLDKLPEYSSDFVVGGTGVKGFSLLKLTYYRSHTITNAEFLFKDGSGPKLREKHLPEGWYIGWEHLSARISGRLPLIEGTLRFVDPSNELSLKAEARYIQKFSLREGLYCLVSKPHWTATRPPRTGLFFRVGPDILNPIPHEVEQPRP